MNEDKVRKAAEVATDIAIGAHAPEFAFQAIWQSVFQAMVSEPWPFPANATATGAALTSETDPTRLAELRSKYEPPADPA